MLQKLIDLASSEDMQISVKELDLLLKTAEEAGMLPPTVVFYATGDYEKFKNLDVLSDYDMGFEWEPDGETEQD